MLQRQVNLLKGYTLLQEVKLRKEAKARAFEAIRAASARLDIDNVETLAEDEALEFKSNFYIDAEFITLANMDVNEHFAKNLAEKIDIEKQKQDETLNTLKNEFTDVQERYQAGASAIAKILGRRQQNSLLRTFAALEEKPEADKAAPAASKEFAANFLFNTL